MEYQSHFSGKNFEIGGGGRESKIKGFHFIENMNFRRREEDTRSGNLNVKYDFAISLNSRIPL